MTSRLTDPDQLNRAFVVLLAIASWRVAAEEDETRPTTFGNDAPSQHYSSMTSQDKKKKNTAVSSRVYRGKISNFQLFDLGLSASKICVNSFSALKRVRT